MQHAQRDSGLHLLDTLLDEQARADSSHALNTAVIDAKIRLEDLRFELLSSSHPSSFTELRDKLAKLLLDLPSGRAMVAIRHLRRLPPPARLAWR